MALLKIARMGHPVLRVPAAVVDEPTAPWVRRLVADMLETMEDAGLDGHLIEREAAGFHARVVQHECDHLDGILYPQRMTDHRLLVFLDELQRHPIDLAAFAGEAAP